MEIENKELKFKIYNTLGKNYEEELEEEELKNVKTISINKQNQDAEDILFVAKDFEALKYVESLTLNSFEITDELVEQIALMQNLNSLTLNYCKFLTKTTINNPLKRLIVTYSENFDLSLFSNISVLEMLQLVEGKIDIASLRECEKLHDIYLYECEIKNFEMLVELEKLKEVRLDGSNILEDVCEFLKKKNIEIHYKERYLPV